MYRQRKNDWRGDERQLLRIFKDVTRYGGAYNKAASIGAFLLFGSKMFYDHIFCETVRRALTTRFDALRFGNHCNSAYRKQKENAANAAEAAMQIELEALGLRLLDTKVVLRAIRAAAFTHYLADVDESRRFAQ